MVIPEVRVGSCLILRVLEGHSVNHLADWLIGEPGFVGLDIEQVFHLILFFLTGASTLRKNNCPSIYTRPVPFTTEVEGYLLFWGKRG